MNIYAFQNYNSVEGTINNGVTNTAISFGDLTRVYNCVISNDDPSGSISIRLKVGKNTAFGSALTIKAGESLEISEISISTMDMSNASGNNCAYRVKLFGE